MSDDIISLLKNRTGKKYPYFYNIMPIENIKSVIENGILSYNKAKKIEHFSVAMDEIQNRRENVSIPGGGKLHNYANLYYVYNNPMMYKRRNNAEKLCVLVVDCDVLKSEGCILTDRNASTDLVKFYSVVDGLKNIDFKKVYLKNWNNDNEREKRINKAIKCAEILIPDYIPYDYIIGAYVLNEENKQKLIDDGFDKKIEVDKNVFYR